MNTVLYPKSPENLPKNLTKLPSNYKVKATLAILAILLFFILYTALVICLGYLVYYAFTYNVTSVNKFTILLKIGAIAGAVMLFVFTLKFIFKLKNHKPQNRIKLKKEDHPNLWDFIDKICSETGAPKPKNIFIDPDVNAYVAYTNVWLSLFLPIKKELTIGLGLTSCLNLSEFKAVITHEFGHFAQSSMKIGSYINSANTIIHDMIYARDSWDNALDQWRASDIRLSAAAWAITPIIWIIRQTLALFYQFLNIMYSSLSREMEFNADKVAVSTSGSDAIISALWKLDSGFEHWNNTINNAYLASKKKIYTDNLYNHNNILLKKHEPELNIKFNQLETSKHGGKQYFSSSENSKVSMYASHPPNDKREANAKQPYVTCLEDKRSPWLLFNNHSQLQLEATQLVYKQYIGKEVSTFNTVEEFENFIYTENRGKELIEEYGTSFKNRFLQIETDDILRQRAAKISFNSDTIPKIKEQLAKLMQPVKEIEALMDKAIAISEGTTKEVSFNFKGKSYKRKNIQEGYLELNQEREEQFNNNFKDWDLDFCASHLALAQQQNKEEKLLNIYNQHRIICEIYKALINTKNHILTEINKLQSRDDVEQHEVVRLSSNIKDWHFDLNAILSKIDTCFIPLSNIDTIQELKEAIIENGEFTRKKAGDIFENGEINFIMNDIEAGINHCQRIDQKSIQLILETHKKLQEKAS